MAKRLYGTEAGKSKREQGQRWLARIKAAEKLEDTWIQDAEKAVAAFTGHTDGIKDGVAYDFNIIYANTETIVPAVINSPPAPDIRRRFGDADPVAKDMAEIIERSIRIQVDDSKLQIELEGMAQDAFLAGRGIVRLRFRHKDDGEPSRAAIQKLAEDSDAGGSGSVRDDEEAGDDDAGAEGGDASEDQGRDAEAGKPVTGERVTFEAVSWRDYRHGPSKRWEDRPWDAFRQAMQSDDVDRFQDGGLVSSQLEAADKTEKGETDADVIVWEIWDKSKRRVIFVRDVDGVILKEIDDPLELTGFFPIATPVQPIELTGRLMPVNPFSIYRQLADDLDLTTRRIAILTRAMRVKWFYAGSPKDMEAIVAADDVEGVPLQDVELAMAAGGIDKTVMFWPIEKFATAIKELYVARDQIKQAIYEITGISDIVRGASNAQETLGAQEIKSQWGSLRIQKMQRMMMRAARDIFVMMSEVISTKFSDKTLEEMTSIQLIPTQQDLTPTPPPQLPPAPQPGQPVDPAMAEQVQQAKAQWEQAEGARKAKLAHIAALKELMKKPMSAFFRIDVESDSTVKADLTRQKGEMTEFMTAAGGYFASVGPLIADGTMPKDVAGEIFGGVARMFNLPKGGEDAIDRWLLNAKEESENPQPKPPGPEEIKAQSEEKKLELQSQIAGAKAQTDQAKAQSDQAIAQAKAQSDQAAAQVQIQTIQAKAQADIASVNAKTESARIQSQTDMQAAQFQRQADTEAHQMAMQEGALGLRKIEAEIEKIKASTASAVVSTAAKADLAERNQDFKEKQATKEPA